MRRFVKARLIAGAQASPYRVTRQQHIQRLSSPPPAHAMALSSTPLRARGALGSRRSAGLAGAARVRAAAPARPLRCAPPATAAAAAQEPLMVRALRGEKARDACCACAACARTSPQLR